MSPCLDDVRLETTIFGKSGSSPTPDKIVGQIESGLTEIYCISGQPAWFASGDCDNEIICC